MSTPYYDWIAHHAVARPGQLALVDLETGRSSTYAQLHLRVGQLAALLRERCAVRQGERVAALSHNRGELLELMLACARLGAVYLPLNWRLTVPELTFVARDATPCLLVADEACEAAALALQVASSIPRLLPIAELGPDCATLRAVGEPISQAAKLTHADVQMLMYTSGTTGRPKGALVTYGMTFWNAVNVGLPARIGPQTRLLSVMPLFHTGGLNLFANPVLHAGGTVLLMRAFDPEAMLGALCDPALAITHTFAVPTAYQAMARHPRFAAAAFDTLEVACVGGAATPASVLAEWHGHGVDLANGYGMTETSPAVTLLLPEDAQRAPGSVGRPLLHTQIRIVDRSGQDVGVDEPGELLVRGPNVTPGYWNDAAATEAAFVDGWLRTGDVIRRDAAGFCFVLDRAKDMYISGGENVYPAEVEAVLGDMPGVAEAAVIGVADENWGETGIAIIVPAAGVALEADAVLAHCARRLARFKLPRRIVLAAELPRTATGKIHKPSLRARFAEPAGIAPSR